VTPSHSATAPAKRPAAADPTVVPPDGFEARAAKLLGRREPVTAGRLHFTNIAAIKERFGEGWPDMAIKADALMRRTIARRLTPSDLYRTGDDLDVVFLFPALVPQEGRLKCAQLGEEIARMLVDEFKTEVQVDAAAIAVDSKAMIEVIQQDGDLSEAVAGEIARASSDLR
jgi:hypothetical protein